MSRIKLDGVFGVSIVPIPFNFCEAKIGAVPIPINRSKAEIGAVLITFQEKNKNQGCPNYSIYVKNFKVGIGGDYTKLQSISHSRYEQLHTVIATGLIKEFAEAFQTNIFTEQAHKFKNAGAGSASRKNKTQRVNNVFGF